MVSTALAQNALSSWQAGDHYEILRVGPKADDDTIDRIYRTLADRFHPDNPATGDAGTYLRVREAYETLSSPVRRAEYNALRQHSLGNARFGLRAREFFDGVRGEQNRRLAVLCLLYRQRISADDSPGRSMLELEQWTGCTREELASALWYLCEKKWVTLGEFSQYSITAEGFDVVESRLEERSEFRAFATLRYYESHPEPESICAPPRAGSAGSVAGSPALPASLPALPELPPVRHKVTVSDFIHSCRTGHPDRQAPGAPAGGNLPPQRQELSQSFLP